MPVVVLNDLSQTQRRAYIIADNKLAQNAGCDEDMLRVEPGALKECEHDLDLVGFSDDELEEYFAIQKKRSLAWHEHPQHRTSRHRQYALLRTTCDCARLTLRSKQTTIQRESHIFHLIPLCATHYMQF
jgi:hypothetical protein